MNKKEDDNLTTDVIKLWREKIKDAEEVIYRTLAIEGSCHTEERALEAAREYIRKHHDD